MTGSTRPYEHMPCFGSSVATHSLESEFSRVQSLPSQGAIIPCRRSPRRLSSALSPPSFDWMFPRPTVTHPRISRAKHHQSHDTFPPFFATWSRSGYTNPFAGASDGRSTTGSARVDPSAAPAAIAVRSRLNSSHSCCATAAAPAWSTGAISR